MSDRIKSAARALAVKNVSIEGCVCEMCGTFEKLHRHHDDYSKPLDVKIVCASCHRKLHRGQPKRRTSAWERAKIKEMASEHAGDRQRWTYLDIAEKLNVPYSTVLAIGVRTPLDPSKRSFLVKPKEAADELSVSLDTLRQMIAIGDIRALRTPGGHIRIAHEELERYARGSTEPKENE